MKFKDIASAVLGFLGITLLGFGLFTFFLLGVGIAIAIPATIVYGFWNWVMVPTFAFKAITFLQAMLSVLFCGFIGGLFRAKSIVKKEI